MRWGEDRNHDARKACAIDLSQARIGSRGEALFHSCGCWAEDRNIGIFMYPKRILDCCAGYHRGIQPEGEQDVCMMLVMISLCFALHNLGPLR